MNFLFKIFIKNYEDTSDVAVRNQYGKFSGVFGIFSNAILFLIKLILGMVTSSISITADAINNLCDAGSSIITIFGFKIAGKPADAKHHCVFQQVADMPCGIERAAEHGAVRPERIESGNRKDDCSDPERQQNADQEGEQIAEPDEERGFFFHFFTSELERSPVI